MKRMLKLFSVMLALVMTFSISAMAAENDYQNNNVLGATQSEFEQLIVEIQDIKDTYSDYT
ncbi:MAG TPA: hypothetical protein DCZ23_06715, partial [Lachnospiraceae bacterium]|nr:hypothetical protein [Lachnospiraceae bacterium]